MRNMMGRSISGSGRSPWLSRPHPATLLGAVALVALAVLGGLSLGSSSSSPARLSAVAMATPTPQEITIAQRQLMNKIPVGYDPSSCVGASDVAPGALAALDCTNNANGGPSFARYQNFDTARALLDAFDREVVGGEFTNGACPGGMQSPGRWYYKPTPSIEGGSVLCGTYGNGDFALVWTRDSELLLGSARGSDVNAVYEWWRQYA
jgi:serine/threonine kinase PknH